MRRIRDPQQLRLFDPFQGVLAGMARRRILGGWQGVFRAVVLQLLPVGPLARHFSADPVFHSRSRGCPTKELYSMAGLVFLADFFDWNALDAYRMRADVQFALNLEPGRSVPTEPSSVIASCSPRTISRRGSSPN